ncbi:MAG: hypothetical protein JWN34_5054 [Bryobacterales bacterium]|nr:hypothetical protein [Bryobacterales bacterium]
MCCSFLNLSLVMALALSAHAQTTFDVASIRLTTEHIDFERDGQTTVLHGVVRMHDVPVSGCIAFAYAIRDSQILGPASLRDKRYDILAKANPDASESQVRQMMQTLLAERFHLTSHREQKEMRGYVLTVATAPNDRGKFHASAADGEVYRRNSASGTVARNLTMKQFADFLSRPLEAPVADDTNLTGKYDLQLEFARYVELTATTSRNDQASPMFLTRH